MKKIKVLHVTFDMTIGGAQQVIRQLVENMDDSKVQSEIVCIDGKLGEIGEMLQDIGISIHLLKRQQGFDFDLIKQLRKLVKSNQYDVIHCHQYTPYLYGLIASLFTSGSVIFTEHGRFYPDYGTWKRKLLNPFFSLLTAKITSISEATKFALVKYENFNSSDIDVIYNGIQDYSRIKVDETSLKLEFNIPQNDFIFGTISRLQPIKNQEMMIKAFAKVHEKNRNIHLLVVGDGESKERLESLANELHLEGNIVFTGFQRNPFLFHKIIDVFLLTSFSEGTSMTLLEAMSFSKPCIVTNVGGNPELIKHNENGFLISSGDIENFSNMMEKLLNKPKILARMGHDGRKKYLSMFSIQNFISSFNSIYKEMK